jgi:hypothetical protein
MLVADREGRDHPHRGGQGGDRRGIQRVAGSTHYGVETRRCPDQRRTVIEPVVRVELGVEVRRETRLDVGREVTSGDDPGLALAH